MWILVSNKRIDNLEKRLRVLETCVSDLELEGDMEFLEKKIRNLESSVSDLKKETEIPFFPKDRFWGFGPLPTISIKEAISQLIALLNLEIGYKYPERARFTLRKIDEKKK